jgi:hypothetical protein
MYVGAGGVLIFRRQRQYIQLFNEKGAIDSEHMITLDEIGMKRGLIFNKMLRRGIFIEGESGKFYVDNQAVLKSKGNRGLRVFLTLLVVTIIFVLCYLK